MRFFKNIVLIIAGLFILTLYAPRVYAKPLTHEDCGDLRKQRTEMETKGLKARVAKGAKWASDNLNEEQIGEVGVFLKVLEDLRFRCNKSAQGKKNKMRGRKVPLPIRNPRRMSKKKADVGKVRTPVASSSKLPAKTKAVISAITQGAGSNQAGSVPPMRKTFGE